MPEEHKALVWDQTGERWYHTGTNHGVLYPMNNGTYGKGVAWNGLTGVDESPDGAEANDLWADNMKYASFRSAETYGFTINAYTYPDEFAACDGSAVLDTVPGVRFGQQKRKPFGFSFRTEVGNDADDEAYILHLVYGATANPSDKDHETINDNPDAIEFSWECETTGVIPTNTAITKPVCTIEIDSRTANATKLKALEKILYGSAEADAKLPTPDEVITQMTAP